MSKRKDLALSFAGAVGALVGYVAIGAAYNRFFLDTTETYYANQHLDASTALTALFKRNADVRVVELGSASGKVYCGLNFGMCRSEPNSSGLKSSDERMVTPKSLKLWFGSPKVIHFSKLEKGYAKRQIDEVFQKELKNPAVTDEMFFTSTLLHELGHVEASKLPGMDGQTLLTSQRELLADLNAAPFMAAEYGETGSRLDIALRSLNYVDLNHDTSLDLQNIVAGKPPVDPVKNLQSWKSFYDYATACITVAQKTKPDTHALDAIKSCKIPLPESADPEITKLTHRRAANFQTSYDFLFGN